jgi:Na+-driven multidrug efflux pump
MRLSRLLLGWIVSCHVGFSGAWAAPFRSSNAANLTPPVTAAGATSSATSTTALVMTATDDQEGRENHESPSFATLGHPPVLPTLAQYRQFALPCLGLWIAGPLLSLVDTAFIGLSGPASQSAQQLAALGPATTFFDGATYLFAFLNVATTNLYSSALAQNNDDKNSPEAEGVVRTAAQVSVNCGIGIMIFLLAVCRPLLALYIGDQAASTPGLLDGAVAYVSIRALSMPTTLLLGVLQSSLLGAKDSVTPLIAIAYSTVVNVIGDYILVNRLKMGLPGAAIATTLAQLAATAALLGPARRQLVKDHALRLFRRKPVSTTTTKTFVSFAAPVLTLILGKLAAFGFMTNAAAGLAGQPTPLASHQIILSLLFFCSPFFEVLSQTAQTFLPAYLAPLTDYLQGRPIDESDKTVMEWKEAGQTVATHLLEIGMSVAAGVASLASLVPAYCAFFITSDPVVQSAVKPLAKYLWLGAFFWAPVAVSEGILLARRELGFLAGVYLMSTVLLPPALMRIKFQQGSVSAVWACFGIFQVFRTIFFTGRIWWIPALQRLFPGKRPAEKATVKLA